MERYIHKKREDEGSAVFTDSWVSVQASTYVLNSHVENML